MECWYIECENGSRSRTHDTLKQARTALPAMQSALARLDPNYSKPVQFVSSEGEVRPLQEKAGQEHAEPMAPER
jgi:hypothetical protein